MYPFNWERERFRERNFWESVGAVADNPVGQASGLARTALIHRKNVAIIRDHFRQASGLTYPMLASPITLRSAVIAISPNCLGGICQICGFISSTETWPV